MDGQDDDGAQMETTPAVDSGELENPSLHQDTLKSPGNDEVKVDPENTNPAPVQAPVTQTPADGPPELWVETKTDSGKSYYYHSVTRETTWTKPEGNVRILSQAELEKINAAKQAPVIPAVIDPVRRPPPVLFGAPPPRFAMPPPLGMPPPGFGAPTWMIPQATQPPPANLHIDPIIMAKAAEWTEHKAPDGRTFFYNASKGESVWERPEALVQLEASRLAAMHSQQMAKSQPIPLMQHPPLIPPHLLHLQQQPPALMATQLGPPPLMHPPGGAAWMQQVMASAEVQKRQMDEQQMQRNMKEQEERNRAHAAQVAAVAKTPVDKSKPVSSTPITGTPW